MAIVKKRIKIVLSCDSVRDVLDRDAYVLIIVKGCAKVYFFVGRHELSTRCQDCAVEDYFDGDKISSFIADIAELVDDIATNSPSDAIFFTFSIFLQKLSEGKW